eukprot:752121-Hanusia_phi.AAC.2
MAGIRSVQAQWQAAERLSSESRAAGGGSSDSSMDAVAKNKSAGIDRDFIRRLAKLLPILIPSPFCKESFYLVDSTSLQGQSQCQAEMRLNGAGCRNILLDLHTIS